MNAPRWVFKGSRDYLHSTTVFDRLMAEVGGRPAKLDFQFKSRTDRQCEIVAARPADETRVVATYADAGHVLHVVSTDAPITERVPYDEDGLARSFTLASGAIRVPGAVPGYSFIECAVAAYKRLLLSLQDRPRRFNFVRLSLAHVPQGAFGIAFDRALAGAFYQGSLREDGPVVGRIFFGEWT